MKFKNNEYYNINLDDNLIAWKVQQEYPINISFKPVIISKINEDYILDISELPYIINEYGIETTLENYSPGILFSVFDDIVLNDVKKIFDNNHKKMAVLFIQPALISLLNVINESDEIDLLRKDFINQMYKEVQSVNDLKIFIESMYSVINDIFSQINMNKEGVEEWLVNMYIVLGRLIHSQHIYNSENPDKSFDDDTDNPYYMYKTKYETSYFFPNGIK